MIAADHFDNYLSELADLKIKAYKDISCMTKRGMSTIVLL